MGSFRGFLMLILEQKFKVVLRGILGVFDGDFWRNFGVLKVILGRF